MPIWWMTLPLTVNGRIRSVTMALTSISLRRVESTVQSRFLTPISLGQFRRDLHEGLGLQLGGMRA